MNRLTLILSLVIITFLGISCNDEAKEVVVLPVESKTITNLSAQQTTDFTTAPPTTSGDFTKFSFKKGTTVTDDTWDIAFRGTTILVNGGTKIGSLSGEPEKTGNASLTIETGTFASVTTAPSDSDFSQDDKESYAVPSGSGNGWYTYAGPPTHLISPIAGKIIVVKTIDGNYAKLEIISYYKDNDPSKQENSRYYTFNYIYNPNKGDKNIQ